MLLADITGDSVFSLNCGFLVLAQGLKYSTPKELLDELPNLYYTTLQGSSKLL